MSLLQGHGPQFPCISPVLLSDGLPQALGTAGSQAAQGYYSLNTQGPSDTRKQTPSP